MYRRPKFLEILLHIREEMAREADYDVDRFAEITRSGLRKKGLRDHSLTEDRDETTSKGSRRIKTKIVIPL